MAVVGFKYFFGIHMGVSRGPVDELVEIKVGDKTVWRGNQAVSGEVTIDSPDVFGGEDGEGGIQGPLTVMMGEPTQVAPPALATTLKSPMPGFRRRFTVFFDGLISMMNPYPKPWAFRVRRALKGWDGDPWYPEKAIISLTRPVSAGEKQGGTYGETKTLSGSLTSYVDYYDPTTGWTPATALTSPKTLTLTGLAGALVSVDSIKFEYVAGDTGDGTYGGTFFAEMVPGVDYTVAGNVISFTSDYAPPIHVGGPGVWYFPDRPLYITYSYSWTETLPPLIGLGDALIQAMNPVHIVYEAMTNREWGRGFDRARFADDSWRYAADILFAEKFGLCIRWTRRDSIKSFIQNILDHIGATVYEDRTNAKIKINLIRGDYVKANLPLFDHDSGLLEIKDADVSNQSGMINEVRVTYRDPVTDEDRTVRASNLAALQSAGGAINSLSKEYKGCPTAELATRLAQRDLKAASPSVRRYKFSLDRRGYKIVPGMVIRIQDMSRGIPDTVVRVGTIDYGKVGDGKIEINGVQDVFALPQRGFTTIGPPQWTPPSNRPCIGESRAFEIPYRSLYRGLSAAEFSFVDNASAYVGTVCEEGQAVNATYSIAVKPGAVDPSENPPDTSYVCPI